jgi:sodium/bile acid cotransporter 7
MVLAWYALRLFFPDEPKLRVMGLFGATHKTVAMGLPLISAIYDGNPNIGLYSLPLLCWHPLQLLLGSLLVPRLAAFVKREEERLGIVDQPTSGTHHEAPLSTDPASATEEGRAQPSAVSCTSTVVMKGSIAIDVTAEDYEEDATDSNP